MPSTKHSQCRSAEIYIQGNTRSHLQDDESSTSSTLAVLDNIDSSDCNVAPGVLLSTRKKSVHFDEERNISYCNTTMAKEDCADLWYNSEDYSHFATSTECLAIKMGRADERSQSQFSFERVLLRLYGACCQCPYETTDGNLLTLVEEVHLQHWMTESPGRLGLESLSIRLIDEDRMDRHAALLNLIRDLQEMKGLTNSTAKAELVRQSCEIHSRPSRLFAMHLAQNWLQS
jgi:hypothetical protein